MTYRNSPRAWMLLVRWPNLLIVALTQCVAWFAVIAPLENDVRVLTPAGFMLLCLSTVLIAAAGYIINDYFDIRIDVINKPDKVILERLIPRRAAIKVHWLFNGLALIFAAAIAFHAGHPEWLLLQLCCIALLWRYSTTWKRQFMIGNVIVALMTALTIVVLVVYEPSLFGARPAPAKPHNAQPLSTLLLFSLFAFLLTWMREIVKDMEDYKGDDAEGCVTMPIRWGLLRSTRFVQLLGALASAALLLAIAALIYYVPQAWRLMQLYVMIAGVLIPLIYWSLKLQTGASSGHYHKVSSGLKLVMVFGILSLALLYIF